MEMDWPDWLPARRLLDLPESWRDLLEESPLRVEEYEQDNQLVVRVEMPGLDPEKDADITVTDHTLHIKAERRQESKTEDKKGYRSEFRYGSYERTISLPAGASEQDVKASYTDGILEVRIPINTEEAAAKKVPIERK
jgi:HSP20 family protein